MLSMKMKIAFILIGAVCLIHLSQAAAVKAKRDVKEEAKDATKEAGNMFTDLQTKVDGFFKDGIQFDKLAAQAEDALKKAGDKIQSASKDFADSLSKKTDELIEGAKKLTESKPATNP